MSALCYLHSDATNFNIINDTIVIYVPHMNKFSHCDCYIDISYVEVNLLYFLLPSHFLLFSRILILHRTTKAIVMKMQMK